MDDDYEADGPAFEDTTADSFYDEETWDYSPALFSWRQFAGNALGLPAVFLRGTASWLDSVQDQLFQAHVLDRKNRERLDAKAEAARLLAGLDAL